ncbi:MAG: thiol peroxidase [Flammeovirgaceae bacterium]|nr:thiol peroxidase [Flammeovirgaceae bacterium]MDW8286458.1 thiol peroxidase [Flammeovirgaceae bacterium]
MANITFKGNPIHTNGELPKVGSKAPDFVLTKADLTTSSLKDYLGKKVILNVFPSIDTGVCATSVRTFNAKASQLDNTVILCISKDLPFAQKRFCGAEGLDKVITLSDYKSGKFGDTYGLKIINGPLEALLARAVIVIDETGTVKYTELVPEIAQEPNYDKALSALGQ